MRIIFSINEIRGDGQYMVNTSYVRSRTQYASYLTSSAFTRYSCFTFSATLELIGLV